MKVYAARLAHGEGAVDVSALRAAFAERTRRRWRSLYSWLDQWLSIGHRRVRTCASAAPAPTEGSTADALAIRYEAAGSRLREIDRVAIVTLRRRERTRRIARDGAHRGRRLTTSPAPLRRWPSPHGRRSLVRIATFWRYQP